MIATAIIMGAVASILGELLINVAGEFAADQLFGNYRAFMVGRRSNHDLQKAFLRAYGHAMQALYRRYLDDHPHLPKQSRKRLKQQMRNLIHDVQTGETDLVNNQAFVGAISEVPQVQDESYERLLTQVRASYGNDAPPDFMAYLEQHLADEIRFFLWEELKVDERAHRAFEYNVLMDMRRDMNTILAAMASAMPVVQQRLDEVAPQAARLASLAAPRTRPTDASAKQRKDKAAPAATSLTPIARLILDLRDDDPHQRARAAQELLALQSDEAVEQLRSLLQAPDEDLQLYATFILGHIRPGSVAIELVRLTSRNQPASDIRTYAADLLRNARSTEMAEQLAASFAALTDENDLECATSALLDLGDLAIEALQAAADGYLAHKQWVPARYALFALHQLAPDSAARGLRQLMQHDPDADVRAHVASLLPPKPRPVSSRGAKRA